MQAARFFSHICFFKRRAPVGKNSTAPAIVLKGNAAAGQLNRVDLLVEWKRHGVLTPASGLQPAPWNTEPERKMFSLRLAVGGCDSTPVWVVYLGRLRGGED